MKNKIGLLGLLGFVGLLGLVTDNPGFYGFFGFFAFFGFLNIIPDELFKLNVNKAAKNAFFSGLFVYPIITIVGAFTSFLLAYAFGFAVICALQILVFSISLSMYEKNGDK